MNTLNTVKHYAESFGWLLRLLTTLATWAITILIAYAVLWARFTFVTRDDFRKGTLETHQMVENLNDKLNRQSAAVMSVQTRTTMILRELDVIEQRQRRNSGEYPENGD